ncbi:unnamed protein product [Sphagnum troendelagicum]|uniref:Uncharacterized protein n=1 Tax=Sphagnum troendelagicum TaxID=128251 RepID=A0ABP0ULH1_9BRYO
MREHLRRYVNLSRRRHHMDLVCHFNSADTTTCRAMVSCCRCTLNGCFPSFQKHHDLRFDNNTIAGTTLGGERSKVSGITKSQGRLHLWQWQSALINPWSSLKNPRQKNGLSSSGWTHNYQVASAYLLLTCVRGFVVPLVEMFKTTPPSWSKVVLMLVSLDSYAIYYLAVKASEPLVQLTHLAAKNETELMEEEIMLLNLTTQLVKLFRRLRNIAISTAVTNCAQIVDSTLHLNDPTFVATCSKFAGTICLLACSP